MAEPALTFSGICRENSLPVAQDQLKQIEQYTRFLAEWNVKVNLISRRDEGNIWFSHVLHSVSVLFLVDIPVGLKILDLGSGGGLPGVPLAILRRDLHITLLDSIQKKTKALADIVGRLGLGNVDVVTARAEEIGEGGESRKFDIVVARAVAPLQDLVRWSRPLFKGLGKTRRSDASGIREGKKRFKLPYLLAWKGGDLESEIVVAKVKTGVQQIEVIDLVFPGSVELGLEEKKLVVIEF